jgi:hypothetical protein
MVEMKMHESFKPNSWAQGVYPDSLKNISDFFESAKLDAAFLKEIGNIPLPKFMLR